MNETNAQTYRHAPGALVATVVRRRRLGPRAADVAIGELACVEALPLLAAEHLADRWNEAVGELVRSGQLRRCELRPRCDRPATQVVTDRAGQTVPGCEFHAQEALRYIAGSTAAPIEQVPV